MKHQVELLSHPTVRPWQKASGGDEGRPFASPKGLCKIATQEMYKFLPLCKLTGKTLGKSLPLGFPEACFRQQHQHARLAVPYGTTSMYSISC
jgi:hypothetical protein